MSNSNSHLPDVTISADLALSVLKELSNYKQRLAQHSATPVRTPYLDAEYDELAAAVTKQTGVEIDPIDA
jgi:hypothetical protein